MGQCGVRKRSSHTGERPAQNATFVLLRADVYERFRALFEEDPVTEKERLFQLEQFGKRAGWDDPAMDMYDDLDPRRKL